MNMAGVDKFGVIFTIAFVAAMIVIMGTALQVDNAPAAPSVVAPAQTYSPPPTPTPPPVETQAAPQTSSSDNLKYIIRGGIVDSISQDEHHNAVKIIMDSRLDGQLTITLTSDSVTPFDDGTYFVTVDGEEVDFTQVGKKLTIDFMANSQKIMIFGEGYASDGHDDKDAEHEAMMADKAAADKAAADKAAADKAAADKAAADKAAADKAAADKAAADKAAAAAAKAPMAVTIEPVAGSGAPGCEPECYSPSTATISAGGTVTFDNTDNAPHTATSGTAANGPDGIFDSSLIMINSSYSVTLSDSGNYPYFCMVHPWMEGTVIVE
jgi:plastocyanin